MVLNFYVLQEFLFLCMAFSGLVYSQVAIMSISNIAPLTINHTGSNSSCIAYKITKLFNQREQTIVEWLPASKPPDIITLSCLQGMKKSWRGGLKEGIGEGILHCEGTEPITVLLYYRARVPGVDGQCQK